MARKQHTGDELVPGQRRVAWPPERWPATDREAWERAWRSGDFMEDAGDAAVWSASTRHSLVGAYGRWLAYLAEHGQLDTAAAPEERVTPVAIRAYVAYLQTRCASVTVSGYVAWLSMLVQAMAPRRDWGWLRAFQAGLHRIAKPIRDQRSRIVPVGELLQLGLDLMLKAEAAQSEAGTVTGRRAQAKVILDFRDGLMIALLAMRPFRQRNFLDIQIGRHLLKNGPGYVLRFSAKETKHRRPQEMSFPAALIPALERYLSHYRPKLLAMHGPRDQRQPFRASGSHLWISQCAMPFTAIQKSLARHTRPRFGHVVNTHLFRHCAASSVASDDPDHVRICAHILGTNLRTIERHYIMANTLTAAQRHHDTIASIRAEGRRRQRLPKPVGEPPTRLRRIATVQARGAMRKRHST